MRVAGIDCGTNSIRLLVAEAEGGRLRDLVRTMEIVRLGQGVDRTGRFAPEAIERTLAVTSEYAAICRRHRVESIRFAATSATRDASNRDYFLDGIYERLGVPVEIVSGEQEARLSFDGAASVLREKVAADVPVLAVDLGGGSTELVLGTMAKGVQASFSMDVGSVRMRERHLRTDPPTASEVEAARVDIRAALDEAEAHVPIGQARELIGLAGTVTSVTAKHLGLEVYDSQRVHGSRMTLAEIEAATGWFISSSTAQIAQLPFLHPGRVDVIAAGALVWQEVVRRVAERMAAAGHMLESVITSEHDILDGLALWAASEPQVPAGAG